MLPLPNHPKNDKIVNKVAGILGESSAVPYIILASTFINVFLLLFYIQIFKLILYISIRRKLQCLLSIAFITTVCLQQN